MITKEFRMKIRLAIPLILAFCLGCSNSTSVPNGASATTESASDRKYPIAAVATVGMVADIVRNVGAEHLSVLQHLLLPFLGSTGQEKISLGARRFLQATIFLPGRLVHDQTFHPSQQTLLLS